VTGARGGAAGSPAVPAGGPPGVSPKFWRLLVEEPLRRHAVLDVGTGRGRLALALAPRCAAVVGVDSDAGAIEDASALARAAGLRNAEFVVADAETFDFSAARPTMVVAHLYQSEGLVRGAAQALPAGGVLAFLGFHADQWRETGRRSRFAWDEDQAVDTLERHGFSVAHLEVDTEVSTFASVEHALAAVVGLEDRWRQDGRWFRYIEYLEKGGRSLTRSHLIVKARKRP